MPHFLCGAKPAVSIIFARDRNFPLFYFISYLEKSQEKRRVKNGSEE